LPKKLRCSRLVSAVSSRNCVCVSVTQKRRRSAFYVASGADSGDLQLCVDGFTLKVRYKRARNLIAGDVRPGYDSR
jgi:hypothetical protein